MTEPPPILPMHVQPAAATAPAAVAWYRRHGWVTLMVVLPQLVSVILTIIGVAERIELIVATSLQAVLTPFVVWILCTGQVYGGRDPSGRWALSTKLTVIVWYLLFCVFLGWMMVSYIQTGHLPHGIRSLGPPE